MNPLSAVAEADDGIRCAPHYRFGERPVFDAAVVAADDHRDRATLIDGQGRDCRFRYRRDTVVDKEHPREFTQLFLAMWQAAKAAGSVERICRVDAECTRHR